MLVALSSAQVHNQSILQLIERLEIEEHRQIKSSQL